MVVAVIKSSNLSDKTLDLEYNAEEFLRVCKKKSTKALAREDEEKGKYLALGKSIKISRGSRSTIIIEN